MPATKILTRHSRGKRGLKIDEKKYETLKKAILSAFKQKDLTHDELFERLDKRLKGLFFGSIHWYGETVMLDLEARNLVERTSSKPPKYRLKST
ncbi:MAG: hypothetical protein H0W66_05275 [Chthoniobacterales bacterium]|nr:hypothetical protein [Chthoniobacterales bacterium]